jgi:chemotaxis protein methyltransferase CheR
VIRDPDGVQFLQWGLPRLHLRWPGFRKVRRQVYKRLNRRMLDLQLSGLDEYRVYLENHPTEWAILDTLCWISISRFYRDKGVFQ